LRLLPVLGSSGEDKATWNIGCSRTDYVRDLMTTFGQPLTISCYLRDAILLLVAFRADLIPGGYRILILGGAIDGLAGGMWFLFILSTSEI
jgi:hypothetical protein